MKYVITGTYHISCGNVPEYTATCLYGTVYNQGGKLLAYNRIAISAIEDIRKQATQSNKITGEDSGWYDQSTQFITRGIKGTQRMWGISKSKHKWEWD